jgi:beta-lactamase class A
MARIGSLTAAASCVAAVCAVGGLTAAMVLLPAAASLAAPGSGTPPAGVQVPGTDVPRPICTSALRPKLAARISSRIEAVLASRVSSVGLAASDPQLGLSCAFHGAWHFDSASAIKATIASTLLRKVGGPSHLTSSDKSLLWLMITESDNDAASALWAEDGMGSLQRFLTAAGMNQTILNAGAWGLSQLTAHDELTLLQVLTSPGHVLSTASRDYVLWLMANVIPSQRWGVPAGAPSDVTVSVKNGWLPYPVSDDWHVNSIGAFLGHDISYQIVVLTGQNPTMDYGVDTIESIAEIINAQIAGA